jgi:hypothetical protein
LINKTSPVSIVHNNPDGVQTQNKNLHNILIWVPQAPNYMSGFKAYIYDYIPIFEAVVNPEGSPIPKYSSCFSIYQLGDVKLMPAPLAPVFVSEFLRCLDNRAVLQLVPLC